MKSVQGSGSVDGSSSRSVKGHSESSNPTRKSRGLKKSVVFLSMLATAPTAALAQNCVSLSGSTTCPAFNTSSISVDKALTGLFPFLNYVKDTDSFDKQLSSYVQTSYVQLKYQTLLGCSNIDLTNTTQLYARFTTSVICNAIIQNSRDQCGLSAEQSQPLCADTCAQQAQSEGRIAADANLCANPGANSVSQIRADFVTCSLPANSLNSGKCIDGIANEPSNCGFGSNTVGLCGYCAAGGENSTETCCYNSKAESRCVGVVLPTITQSIALSTQTSSPTSSPTTAAADHASKGLSGGAIAGIVVGSVAGVALLAALIFALLLCLRRRRGGSQNGSVFNQPSPPRKGSMVQSPTTDPQAPVGYEVLPGGRIARMSALEGNPGDSPPRGGSAIAGGAAAGAAAGYAAGRRHQGSSSSEFGDSPISGQRGGVIRPPPTGRRHGSLSSNSVLGEDPNSPLSGSANGFSSPQGVSSQSEQLPFFRDYYSQDEIHPGDKVATLWAYQPRAGDEFMLERGDMLKVVGIWDDGWATGVMIDERAEEWDEKMNAQRDSGVSNTSGRRDQSPPLTGEIKAFPLVCVCRPEHWTKTIEGDGSTESGGPPPAP